MSEKYSKLPSIQNVPLNITNSGSGKQTLATSASVASGKRGKSFSKSSKPFHMTRSGAGSGFELENEAQKQVLDGFGLGSSNSVVHQMSINLLMDGHIQSFQEFFKLTHELTATPKDQQDNNKKGKPKGEIFQEKPVLPNDETEKAKLLEDLDEDGKTGRFLYTYRSLKKLKDLFTKSERNHLKGDARLEYQSKRNIARHFEFLEDFPNAVTYHQQGLEIAQEYLDIAEILEAKNNLGFSLENSGGINDSLGFYESSMQDAKNNDMKDDEVVSCKRLVKARIRIAEKLDDEDRHEEAIKYYQDTIKIIEESCPGDINLISETNYRLGKVYQHLGNVETAIEYLQLYLDNCRSLQNKAMEGMAQAAIASCYESSGNHTQAIQHFKMFSQLAEEENDIDALANASYQLGQIFDKCGDYVKALEYFEKYHAICCQLYEASAANYAASNKTDDKSANVSSDLIKNARVQLGIAKGNAKLEWFMKRIQDPSNQSISELLDWKSLRLASST